MSQIRILVENAVGDINCFNIFVHRIRDHKPDFDDDVIGICAGLWNLA